MALTFGDNISYQGKKPLDSRMLFDTLENMKNYSENYLPSLAICQCEEDGNLYTYNAENDVDESTGKWRVFEGGGGSEEEITDEEINAAISEEAVTLKQEQLAKLHPNEGVLMPLSFVSDCGYYWSYDSTTYKGQNSLVNDSSSWLPSWVGYLPFYIIYNASAPYYLTKMVIRFYKTNDQSGTGYRWEVLGSNDLKGWHLLKKFTVCPPPSGTTTSTINVDYNFNKYQYYKIQVVNSVGTDNCGIQYIQMYGAK